MMVKKTISTWMDFMKYLIILMMNEHWVVLCYREAERKDIQQQRLCSYY
jgi:hypothetical protein